MRDRLIEIIKKVPYGVGINLENLFLDSRRSTERR